MRYANVAELPPQAVGANGQPVLFFSPVTVDAAAIRSARATGQRIENMPVFRTGNFKDSQGRPGKWTADDLDAMVRHFYELRSKGILVDVPVRQNHTRDVKDVVGYYAEVRRIGDRLYADIELTDPTAAEKYNNGTFRSKSIELGAYETNDGDIYFPTVVGLAFCDIPAVENLFTKAIAGYGDVNTEIQVFSTSDTATGADAADTGPDSLNEDCTMALANLHQAAQKLAGNPAAHAAIQKVIQATEALRNSVIAVAPSAPAAAATHSQREQRTMETFTFALDGVDHEVAGDESTKKVFDAFAASLAQTRASLTETQTALSAVSAEREVEKEANRVAKVDAWLDQKKIVPAQVDGMKAFVKALSDEQFTAHEALIGATPQVAVTVDHTNVENPELTEADAKTQAIASHRKTYEMLKFSGALTPAALAKSKPAKALEALGATVEA